MFIGRQRELGQLNRLYQAGEFEFVVIYGRQRVEKTALVNEFVKDKDAIFLQVWKQMTNRILKI